ncbi:discoidin, CUB and LCCL domain-containing protein 2-like [Branchiostoma floridae]|uniref:Discoidin, CUB and LCCL domain-containing protein 2-like n=1 Tax=Branchiostoma floridae TaxID=7739 RepID=A0A9J7LH04_BRAFL|nr:discoidin, CUB and LCCL domain-containing protein 2-like [Branchiostoma floridae]
MDSFHVVFKFLMYLCVHSLLPVAESGDTVDCSTDSRGFSIDTFTVNCPAGCSPYQYNRRVWGTGVYTSDSSICRAAIHDGRITDDGGQVTVYRWPGQDSYQGSTQNGIETDGFFFSWSSSFAFTRVCRDALGMEHGAIQDGDITASSHQSNWPPSAARLNGNSAWFPSEPFARSWIQVDLRQRKTVSGVITQGYDGRQNYWVTQYQVWYLNNDDVLTAVSSATGRVME